MKNKILKKQKRATGLHVFGEIHTKNLQNLKSPVKIKKSISKIIKKRCLKELGSFYHQFPGKGFTGIVCLVESHIAIHTWPEFGCLTLDVYLCNYSKDNTEDCKKVFDEISKIFQPQKIIKRLIQR